MWLTYFWQILGQQVIYETLNSCKHQKSLFGKDSSKAVVHIARQFELLLAASSDFQNQRYDYSDQKIEPGSRKEIPQILPAK